VWLAAPALALAQPVDPVVAMHEHFDKGQEHYEHKRFDLAASEFRAAFEAKPSASLLYNEAVCYEKLNKFAQAAALFKEYLDKAPQARDRAATEKRIAVLEGKGKPTELPPVEARGFVAIETKPAGATVYLDDRKSEPLGQTPWNGPLTGNHKVFIVAAGYKDAEKEFTADPSRIRDVYIELSQQHYLGWLEVRSNVAAADVYMDGTDPTAIVGKTPYQANVTPGPHAILVGREGFTIDKKQVTIVAGEVHKLDFALDKAPIGFVHVGGTSIEGAIVKLDGKVVCAQAPCRFQSPDGDHDVRVEKPGLKSYVRRMTVVRATETELSVKLMPEESKTDVIWKYAFAAAFIGGGVALGLQANSLHDDLQRDIDKGMPPLAPDDDRFLKGKIYAYAADACFLIGAVTAVVGTVSLLSEHGPPSLGSAEAHDLGKMVDLAPQVGPGYAGLAAAVRW
jgi:hypothetical protein